MLFEGISGGETWAPLLLAEDIGSPVVAGLTSYPTGDALFHMVPLGGEQVVASTSAWCEDSVAEGRVAASSAMVGGDLLISSMLMAAMLSIAGEVGLAIPEAEVEYARARVGAGANVTEAEFCTGGATEEVGGNWGGLVLAFTS